MDTRKHHYGWEVLRWEEDKLFFQEQELVQLIPHEKYVECYYLKLWWRDEPTPEFFNIVNAKENAGRIALHRLNYDTWQRPRGASYSDLNEEVVDM